MAEDNKYPLIRNYMWIPLALVVAWVLFALIFASFEGWLLPAVIAGAIGLLGYFVAFFVGEPDERKRIWWFGFTYVFMLTSLGASIMPFLFLTPEVALKYHDHAISVLVGRVEQDDADEANPWEGPPEWKLNIGGAATVLTKAGDNGDPKRVVDEEGLPLAYRVRGGLVVPLYLIILAFLGGAISLLRRVPEYQKRSAAGYAPTEQEPALDLPLLREFLVFQIVQFLSAPFIAVTAYYVLDPDSKAMVAGLGFLSGFASESILLWIRGGVNKLKPAAASG